jgi:ER lumen protein retaining receptor
MLPDSSLAVRIRFIADISHLLSLFILLYKILSLRLCHGVSLQTQIVNLLSCLCSCAILLFQWNLQFFILKSALVLFSSLVVLLIVGKFKGTYEHRHDSFRITILVIFSAVLSFFSLRVRDFSPFLDAFAIWLDSLAVLPQIVLLPRSKRLDIITPAYTFFTTVWKGFDICGQVCLIHQRDKPVMYWAAIVMGLVVYIIFLVQYMKLKFKIRRPELPYTK